MSEPRSELAAAFLRLNRVFAGLALVSGVINCLALSSSIFMLQIYDRVLSSRSEPTLAALCVLVVLLLGFQGVLEAVRSRILTRVSGHLHAQLGSRVFSCVLALPLRSAVQDDGLTPVRDLDTLRHFVAGPGPSAFFDLPWMPLYLLFVYALHPFLGLLATLGALILVGLTVSTEMMSRGPQRALATQNAQRIGLGLAGRRNAEVLRAMGFGERVTERWLRLNTAFLAEQRRAGDIVGGLGAASRALRILLQSLILALGAWLTIRGQMTAGAIIAASIATTRALAPVELAIGQWKSFVAARDSWRRLARVLSALPPPSPRLDLPAPVASLVVEQLSRAGAAPAERAQRVLCPAGGAGARHHRPQRRRKVDPPARARRCLAARVGSCAPRRGRARPVGRGARPAHRLPAPGRGTARRHHRRQHRPLRGESGRRGGHRRRHGRWRARDDSEPAGRVRNGDRRGGRNPLGRPAATWRSPGHSIAIPSSSFSTSPTPISTRKARTR